MQLAWRALHQNKATSAFGPAKLGVVPLGPKSAMTDKDGGAGLALCACTSVELTPPSSFQHLL